MKKIGKEKFFFWRWILSKIDIFFQVNKYISLRFFCLVLFSLLCSSYVLCVESNVSLFIQDMDQKSLHQVEKGVPFLLQIVVENMDGVKSPGNVTGLEHFQVSPHGSSQSTRIINGHRSERKSFSYVLRADTVGTFQLGPLSVPDKDGNVVTSAPIQVVVGDKAVVHSVSKAPFFLETQVDKKSLYIGQELIVKIRFYYAREF